MSSSGFPPFNEYIGIAWGWPQEVAGPGLSTASNVVISGNPPYSIADFLSLFPQFAAAPKIYSGSVAVNSPMVTLSSVAGLVPNLIVCPVVAIGGATQPGLFTDGTFILSVNPSVNQVTMSQNAIAAGALVAIYNSTWVPLPVLYAYIALASASLMSARWCQMWQMAMGLYVAHFSTLWLRAFIDNAPNAKAVATAGLEKGITTAKSAGGVSASAQVPSQGGPLESWGHWQETTFGQQFAFFANGVGAGPMWLY